MMALPPAYTAKADSTLTPTTVWTADDFDGPAFPPVVIYSAEGVQVAPPKVYKPASQLGPQAKPLAQVIRSRSQRQKRKRGRR